MEFLLECGASVDDQQNISGSTALFQAVNEGDYLCTQSGTYDVVPILLEAGCNVSLRLKDGQNVLHGLLSNTRDDEEQALLAGKLIRRAGEEPNILRPFGGEPSPLYFAVLRNKTGVVRAMLEAAKLVLKKEDLAQTLNLKSVNKAETTVLQVACSSKNYIMARLLMEGGADIDLKTTRMQWTPLHTAIQVMPGFVPELLAQGADPNLADINSDRPIHYAARENRADEIVKLFNAGSDLEAKNDKRRTPLAVAVLFQSEDAIRVLVTLGAQTSELPDSLARSLLLVSLEDGGRQFGTAKRPKPDYDQILVCLILRSCSSRSLPIPVLSRIFDMAQYWLLSTAHRDEYYVVSQRSALFPYVKSAPITGHSNRPVRRLTFTISSHDQGFDDNKGATGNWTWFEARTMINEVFEDAQAGQNVSRQVATHRSFAQFSEDKALFAYLCITENALASREIKTHVITWPEDDIKERDTERLEWMDRLKPGSSVAIVPRAAFPGWENHVYDARIDLYISVLRSKYTRKEKAKFPQLHPLHLSLDR